MKTKKYDTTALRTRILLNCSIKDFTSQVSELSGVGEGAVKEHLFGYRAITDNEYTAIAMLLGIADEDEVRSMIAPMQGNSQPSDGKKHRLSQKQSRSKLTNTPVQENIPDNAKDSPAETVENPRKIETDMPVKTQKLTSVDGILNVFDVFRVINNNLQVILDSKAGETDDSLIFSTVSKTLDLATETEKRVSDVLVRVNTLETENSAIKQILEKMSKKQDIILTGLKTAGMCDFKEEPAPVEEVLEVTEVPETVETQPEEPQPVAFPGQEPPEGYTYDPRDDIDLYYKKIDSFVKVIAAKKKLTMNQVRHDLYQELENAYGVSYSQLQKEYSTDYGKKQTWTLALIHNNALFAEIFFSLAKEQASAK